MRFLLQLVLHVFKLLLLPVLLWRRWRAAPLSAYVELPIEGRVVDIASPRRWFAFQRRPAVALEALRELVDEVRGDPRVRGLVIRLEGLHVGMATAESLRAVLARVRDANHELVVYLPQGADTKETFVAAAADRIIAGPQTTLAPLGFAATTPYFKDALDRAGVIPEVLARGRYKSAGEQLVRTGMSEAQREQVEAVIQRAYDTLVDAIATGRKVDRDRACAIVDAAPYLGEDAVKAGLADATAYDDELPARLAGAGERPRLVKAPRYLRARRAPRFAPMGTRPVIGVVPVHGPIAHGSRGGVGFAADDAVIATVRAARANRRVLGVVLHVDSPGGSALASDRIHHELVQLAQTKPLVAYLSDVAASGGYYVAAAASVIVAQPTTLTGSIGVVAARLALEPLLKRAGIAVDVIKRGAHADLLNPSRPLMPGEREALERELDGVYRAFVRVVAEGRKKTVEAIERVAQGRVWTGADARDQGLVDELGGFDVALASVRSRLGAGAERLRPAVIRAPMWGIPPLDPPAKRAAEVAAVLASLAPELALELAPLALAFGRERILAWSPIASRLA
jgi:protease-4